MKAPKLRFDAGTIGFDEKLFTILQADFEPRSLIRLKKIKLRKT